MRCDRALDGRNMGGCDMDGYSLGGDGVARAAAACAVGVAAARVARAASACAVGAACEIIAILA